MSFRLRALWTTRRPVTRSVTPLRPAFRPGLESFEDRVVPAAPVDLNAGLVAPAAITNNIAITGVNLTNFHIVNNVLHATGTVTGTLAGLPFTTNIADFALNLVPDNPATPGMECSVLHLELAPIHLQLLGLHVDTSRICLDITATQGGGLLGDLLCGLAGGGVGGLGIPTLPTTGQLTGLLDGLTGLLNGALGGLLNSPSQPGGGNNGNGDVCTGQTEVLHLVLGPVNLSLLGLNVSLDNCANGPVEVCVSATRSEGLLGSLLSGLAGNPNLNLTLQEITQIVNQATSLLSNGVISGSGIGQLISLVNHLKK